MGNMLDFGIPCDTDRHDTQGSLQKNIKINMRQKGAAQ
jgi:hypothetical protein